MIAALAAAAHACRLPGQTCSDLRMNAAGIIIFSGQLGGPGLQ